MFDMDDLFVNENDYWFERNAVWTKKYGKLHPQVLDFIPLGETGKWTTVKVRPHCDEDETSISWSAEVCTGKERTTGEICKTFTEAIDNALRKHTKEYGYKFAECFE